MYGHATANSIIVEYYLLSYQDLLNLQLFSNEESFWFHLYLVSISDYY